MVPQNDIFNLEPVIIEQLKSYLSTNPQFTRIYGIFGKSDNWKSFTRRCRKVLKQLKKNFILSVSDFSKESLKTIIPKLISQTK
jgi:hypothetical protein